MENPLDNAKRFKILDELLLSFSNNKIVLKDLNKSMEHQTMLFLNNGVLDIHKTKEGPKKEYESIDKIDLLKSVAKIIANPEELMKSLTQTIECMKEVDFTEEGFEHLTISPIMTKEELAPYLKKTRKKVEISAESINAINSLNLKIPWKDAKEKIQENALVFDKDTPVGYIFKNNGRFHFLQISNIIDTPVIQFFDKMLDEKFDEDTDENTNNMRKEFMKKLMEQNNESSPSHHA